MAFSEELLIDHFTAIPINPNYRDAKVPTHLETPEIEVIFIEHPDPYGPFGGKVVGEPPITRLRGDCRQRYFQRHRQTLQGTSHHTG